MHETRIFLTQDTDGSAQPDKHSFTTECVMYVILQPSLGKELKKLILLPWV